MFILHIWTLKPWIFFNLEYDLTHSNPLDCLRECGLFRLRNDTIFQCPSWQDQAKQRLGVIHNFTSCGSQYKHPPRSNEEGFETLAHNKLCIYIYIYVYIYRQMYIYICIYILYYKQTHSMFGFHFSVGLLLFWCWFGWVRFVGLGVISCHFCLRWWMLLGLIWWAQANSWGCLANPSISKYV